MLPVDCLRRGPLMELCCGTIVLGLCYGLAKPEDASSLAFCCCCHGSIALRAASGIIST